MTLCIRTLGKEKSSVWSIHLKRENWRWWWQEVMRNTQNWVEEAENVADRPSTEDSVGHWCLALIFLQERGAMQGFDMESDLIIDTLSEDHSTSCEQGRWKGQALRKPHSSCNSPGDGGLDEGGAAGKAGTRKSRNMRDTCESRRDRLHQPVWL